MQSGVPPEPAHLSAFTRDRMVHLLKTIVLHRCPPQLRPDLGVGVGSVITDLWGSLEKTEQRFFKIH